MYYLYAVLSHKTDSFYLGITNNIKARWNAHRCSAKSGKVSHLYNSMRKHGIDNFDIVVLSEFVDKDSACVAEIFAIASARKSEHKLLNIAHGGDGGYVIPNDYRDAWISKLKVKRAGRKPALGMKHTDENKRFFSECSKRKEPKFPELDVLSTSFQEAKSKFGISKTHYYRLLKRAKPNELG